ncbi:unnamed protein product [Rotaria magnacalcarata]|uniref:HAT C-terminal dimerisation domain-containing protein n=1 Tax=Rotaria magnacalcarata TaxID=392030 RepID=A0A8S3HIY3_9BILA|nr:unnamed protein product [Rotaria magnacalcarata]
MPIHIDNETDDDEFDLESEESDGIRFFRFRLLELLDSMFVLEPIHFAAAFLHPRYRHLRKCSTAQINSCKNYVRRQMQEIEEREKLKRLFQNQQSKVVVAQDNVAEPPLKKKKDLVKNMNPVNLVTNNPLVIWKANQKNLPLLSKLARMIHCIPATTASVEREFSGSGLFISERRSSINPQKTE